MKNSWRKVISSTILCLLIIAMILPGYGGIAEGAKKVPKLNKRSLILAEKQTKELTIKNVKKAKSIQWKSKNKKYATVKKYKKTRAKVKGIKKGKASIIATVKIGKKKYTLTCKVEVKKKNAISTQKPSSTPTVAGNHPTQVPVRTPRPDQAFNTLKDAYSPYFSIGTAINLNQLQDETTLKFTKTQYNSITLENEMKPQYILGWRAPTLIDVGDAETSVPESYKEAQMPKLNFSTIDQTLEIARANGFPMRGHCLVWHSQTPDWFFRVGYSSGAALVTPEVMSARMENYIKQVLYHIQTNYPDVVYAWDVLNEIFKDEEAGLRTNSNWYLIYGDDSFAFEAFEYARKYADKDVKLFYNDFNTYMTEKPILEEGEEQSSKRESIYEFVKAAYEMDYLDGVGMQSHINVPRPTIQGIQETIERLDSIDPGKIEVQLTELDVSRLDDGEEWQAQFYKELFKMLIVKRKAGVNITNVTFWGLYDEISWRKEQSPLIFTQGFVPKDSYYNILDVAKEAE